MRGREINFYSGEVATEHKIGRKVNAGDKYLGMGAQK